MSAYVVDPRTIDYLVSWAHRHRADHSCPTAFLPEGTEVPEELEAAVNWLTPGSNRTGRLFLAQVSGDDLGKVLMSQNVRSVQSRYSDSSPNDLPGPINQKRIWNYRFKQCFDLNPVWVLSVAGCLRYQSCETPDYPDTLAWKVLDAIREDAIHSITMDAPWGITAKDLGEVAKAETT